MLNKNIQRTRDINHNDESKKQKQTQLKIRLLRSNRFAE